MLTVRYDDLQHFIVNLSVYRIRQDQLQQMILDEVRALINPPQPNPQFSIGSILISLGPAPFSAVHTLIPPMTWGLFPSQPFTTTQPPGSHLTARPSSLPFTQQLSATIQALSRPSTSRYLPSQRLAPILLPSPSNPPTPKPPNPLPRPFLGTKP